IQKSVFLLKNSDGSPKQLDLPNFSIRWSGLESAGPWSVLTSTVSLENGYQASSTTKYGITTTRTENDTITNRIIEQIDYTKNWNPLIGINIQWKNKINTSARYTQTESFNDARKGQAQRARSTQTGIQVTAGYTMQQGFRIPIKMWPFKNKRFKNQTDFSLSYNQSTTRTENAVKPGVEWGPFVEQAFTTTYTLSPKVTMTFSRTVTGYVQYEYGATNSKSGSSKINSFKFNVSIQIRG
ncbi:MAG: hypothetical protein OEM52_12220, partial [bacterium]|nr:hypothetical protein [bacterium]